MNVLDDTRMATVTRPFAANTLLSVILFACSSVSAFQGGKREPTPPAPAPPTISSPPKARPRRPATVRKQAIPTTPQLASITITVSPADSAVWLDEQQMANSGSELTGLKPGPYRLTVRHAGYRDQQLPIELKPGDNDPLRITLEVLKGTLNVMPSVSGASIEVRSVDRNQSVGSYSGAMDNIDLPPGEYELTVSKPGYQGTMRAFTIRSGGTVELEPRLDPLPTPTPTPTPIMLVAARSTVNVEGKELIVRILGTSGETSRTTGTISVTINRAAPTAYVEGSLNGLPCHASFVSLENVAEWSLIDSPSPSNGWALVVVRVRPKDSKRAISFNINWSSIQRSSEPLIEHPNLSDAFSPAVITYKAQPEYPQMARASRTSGVVKVSVLVDEEGKVKSAKAMDGPVMLRQAAENAARQCRFKPATRNGVPTQSTQEIAFVFQLL
jgi:TonB family protein